MARSLYSGPPLAGLLAYGFSHRLAMQMLSRRLPGLFVFNSASGFWRVGSPITVAPPQRIFTAFPLSRLIDRWIARTKPSEAVAPVEWSNDYEC